MHYVEYSIIFSSMCFLHFISQTHSILLPVLPALRYQLLLMPLAAVYLYQHCCQQFRPRQYWYQWGWELLLSSVCYELSLDEMTVKTQTVIKLGLTIWYVICTTYLSAQLYVIYGENLCWCIYRNMVFLYFSKVLEMWISPILLTFSAHERRGLQ